LRVLLVSLRIAGCQEYRCSSALYSLDARSSFSNG